MTYVELIVVLSIFSVVSSVVMFNYGGFQDRIEIKNLASDIAQEIVQAQRSALSGLMPASGAAAGWKPSYGVYFNLSPVTENKSFIYFIDQSNAGFFDGTGCTGECLSKISITKNNYLESLRVYYLDNTSASLSNLAITFSRPDSTAKMSGNGALLSNVSYAEIRVRSPKNSVAIIKIYPAGRIEIN